MSRRLRLFEVRGVRPHVDGVIRRAGLYVATWPMCSAPVHRAMTRIGWTVVPTSRPVLADVAWCRACRERIHGSEGA